MLLLSSIVDVFASQQGVSYLRALVVSPGNVAASFPLVTFHDVCSERTAAVFDYCVYLGGALTVQATACGRTSGNRDPDVGELTQLDHISDSSLACLLLSEIL